MKIAAAVLVHVGVRYIQVIFDVLASIMNVTYPFFGNVCARSPTHIKESVYDAEVASELSLPIR